MPEIKLKARIQNKYETLENWNKIIKGDFIPLEGEVCYGTDDSMLYQKIGDGKTDFVDLPWLLNQADNEENDETSPAYIKNRLAYPEYTEIPEDEQILYADEIISEELGTKEMLLELFTDEQVKSYVNASFNDTNNIFVGATEIAGPEELVQNQFNKLFINIHTDTNNKISYNFNSEDKLQSDLTVGGYSVFCFGNTHWANIITNLFLETVDSPILYYPYDYDSTEKYSIVLIGPLTGDDMVGYLVFVALDNDIYPCQEEEDTDGAILYKHPYDIQLLATGRMHTIDDKYLGEIRSNFNELKLSSKSYIKNRPGVNALLELKDGGYLGDTGLGRYRATITTGPYVNELSSQTLRGESVHEDFYTSEAMVLAETCTVTIAGQTWYNCPVFQTRLQYSADQNDCYYIGNPSYISEHIDKLWGLAMLEGNTIKGYSKYEMEDNGLPFLISYCPYSERPLWDGELIRFPKKYDNKETVSVSIVIEKIRLGANILRKDTLPVDAIVGVLNNETNSILFNSSYKASGANSMAAGQSTQAIGSNSMSLGQKTIAEGNATLSTGVNTWAYGSNSFTGGDSTWAKGPQSVTLGTGAMTLGPSADSFAMGGTINSTYPISSVEHSSAIRIARADRVDYDQVRITYYPPESSSSTTTPWILINNQILLEDEGEYRIILSGDNLTNYNTDLTKFTYVELRKVNVTQNSQSFAFGVGNRANGQRSVVFGVDNVAKDHGQTVFGRYNEIDSGAFFIGNGTSNNSRSNAMKIDWNGDTTFAGSVEATSIILTSPNGTKFKITVNDEGTLTSTSIN